jgi:hypothetical protein
VALVAVIGGVVAATAGALRFTDDSYLTPDGQVGKPYTHTFSAPPAGTSGAGCDPPYIFTVLNGSLPPGLSLGQSTGKVTGTPTQSGSYSFWVELRDDPSDKPWCNAEQPAEREFSIDILPGISIQNQTAKPGTIGQTYSEPLTAMTLTNTTTSPPTGNPATTAVWSLFSGSLPAGVTLAPSGLLAGVPTTEGSYTFVVRAELDPVRWDTETLTIVVRQPLAIKTTKPLGPTSATLVWEVGVPFAAKMSASGGSGTYTWIVAEGALPTGLGVSADGTITGAPQQSGATKATLRLADSEGRTLDYALTFGVAQRLAISTILLKPGKVGRVYKAKLATSGGIKPVSWKLKGVKPPKGLVFDRVAGTLTGIPTKAGVYRLTLEATDTLRVTAVKTLRLIVAP